jgi:hypothetical protein
MRLVRTRPWYLASIALGLVAIAIDTSAKKAASDGMVGMARATQARVDGVPLEVRESMERKASAAAHRSGILSLIGFCVAAGSASSLFVSMHKNESRWNSLPVVVLIAYIMWFFLLV